MTRIELSFGREFAKNLGWMTLIVAGMSAVCGVLSLLLYVAYDRAGVPGSIVLAPILIILVVLAMTIGGRIARRRIRARYERDLATIGQRGDQIR